MTRPTPERLAEIRDIAEHFDTPQLRDALAEIDALLGAVDRITDEELRNMPYSPRDSVARVREWLRAAVVRGST